MIYVLDAHALTTFLEQEPGYERVEELLTAAATSGRALLMTAVNWGEVYYVVHRSHGSEQAQRVVETVDTFPIDIVDVDLVLAKHAALLKVTHRLPYADCFAAALAKQRKATLVTGDRDFKQVEAAIPIVWL